MTGHPSAVFTKSAGKTGFEVAFIGAAILVASGTLLIGFLIRKEDVATIHPEDAPLVPGT